MDKEEIKKALLEECRKNIEYVDRIWGLKWELEDLQHLWQMFRYYLPIPDMTYDPFWVWIDELIQIHNKPIILEKLRKIKEWKDLNN